MILQPSVTRAGQMIGIGPFEAQPKSRSDDYAASNARRIAHRQRNADDAHRRGHNLQSAVVCLNNFLAHGQPLKQPQFGQFLGQHFG